MPAHNLLRRQSFPPWIRLPTLVLTYGFAIPVFRLLDKTGLLPRFAKPIQAQTTRLMGNFGVYQPDQHDILVCSYFKSGTNWMMQIALQIAHYGQAEYDHIHDLIPWPDAFHPRFALPLTDTSHLHFPTGLRVIKTHLALDEIPYNPEAKYICVVRDPKDVFVSSYHFARSVLFGPMMPSVVTWLELFLSPHFPFGSWSQHLQTAWQLRDRENVLFLTYGEMKADSHNTIQHVADFMGIPLTQEELQTVIHKSSFAYMKTIDHKFYPGAVVPWTSPNGKMMRRGQSGGSSEMLTPFQQLSVDEHCHNELLQLGCDFPYNEAFSRKN